jgi:hypothetical protein
MMRPSWRTLPPCARPSTEVFAVPGEKPEQSGDHVETDNLMNRQNKRAGISPKPMTWPTEQARTAHAALRAAPERSW